MDRISRLDHLIDRIYATGCPTDAGEALLREVAECLQFEVCVVATTPARFSDNGCAVAWGIDREASNRAEREFGVTAGTTHLHGREMRPGEVGFREEIIDLAELRKQPYFGDFVLPNRIQDGAKLCLQNSPERGIFANVARPRPDADRQWQEFAIRSLARHWARAAAIHAQLEQNSLLRQSYHEAASMATQPVVVFDNTGKVYLANSRAEALLLGDGLRLVPDGLRASIEGDNQRLQQALQQVLRDSSASEGTARGVDLVVRRPSGRHALRVVIAPLLQGARCGGRRPAAMVVVFDPEATCPLPFERARTLFGFTRAEAEVAAGIMRGESVDSIAKAHGRSVTTTRNLLKRVFQKAGVSRQHELTHVLLTSPLLFQIP